MFSILAPPALYCAADDPSLAVSFSTGEEEPGEGEKKDGCEESPDLPESWLSQPGEQEKLAAQDAHPRPKLPELIWEVASPPPEGKPGC
ncbi:hypothetical protein [Robiginitalea marina]|uniref:Uncharacterized protein n=1 Tax=Robiginitalea marina TaxID=2954105 RepID=A0ABT1AX02_9FLAO|nr:hypothetical protein [Robiginitalea marina]MCO5724421.1 hypothetical protein [Robiginitalea marina]